jgi:hypothetical protein
MSNNMLAGPIDMHWQNAGLGGWGPSPTRTVPGHIGHIIGADSAATVIMMILTTVRVNGTDVRQVLFGDAHLACNLIVA